MSPLKVTASRTVFRGRNNAVRVDTVQMPDGRATSREIVEHGDGVAMVAVDASGKILLVRQYRHAVGCELLEVPAGGVDPGETPEQAARRELQEEIGFIPGSLQKLGGYYTAPGFCTEMLHIYVATELTPSRLVAEDTDEIQTVAISPEDIPELITSGRIEDAKTATGLLEYYLLLRR